MAINCLWWSTNSFACRKVLITWVSYRNYPSLSPLFPPLTCSICFRLFADLSYNRLAKVPNDSFLQLTNLTFLDLSYNKLVRLEPQSVRSLSNLQVLNISGNVLMDLREMHETFEVSLNWPRLMERCHRSIMHCISYWFVYFSADTTTNAFGHCGYGSVASWSVNTFPAVEISEYLG